MQNSIDTDPATIVQRAQQMASLAAEGSPLTQQELDDVITSISNICPNSRKSTSTSDQDVTLQLDMIRQFLQETAHLNYKNWEQTGVNAQALSKLMLPNGLSPSGHQLFERVFTEGNWNGAENQASVCDEKPWAVLVTGVNGIRKTTAMYQDWFSDLLAEALVAPADDEDRKKYFDKASLPSGKNAFFRQLDHMIATICNEEFRHLYQLCGLELNEKLKDPPQELVKKYSDLKAAIFSRYRTLSELVGVMILREAQTKRLSCMMETSGRDVGMFNYIDSFFESSQYNKLALHFTINDLEFARKSVDARMIGEMKKGVEAVKGDAVSDVIYANAGGPYGSEVLAGVQEASDRVWDEVVMTNQVGENWYKAVIEINAYEDKPWTAAAVKPDGTRGTEFEFKR